MIIKAKGAELEYLESPNTEIGKVMAKINA